MEAAMVIMGCVAWTIIVIIKHQNARGAKLDACGAKFRNLIDEAIMTSNPKSSDDKDEIASNAMLNAYKALVKYAPHDPRHLLDATDEVADEKIKNPDKRAALKFRIQRIRLESYFISQQQYESNIRALQSGLAWSRVK